MTSPNTIIADLMAEVEMLRKQRDGLLHALSMIEPGLNFDGWENSEGDPIGEEINAIVSMVKGESC